jgi:hypothetical protein
MASPSPLDELRAALDAFARRFGPTETVSACLDWAASTAAPRWLLAVPVVLADVAAHRAARSPPTLPLETLGHVFSFCAAPALGAAAQACRRWRAALDAHWLPAWTGAHAADPRLLDRVRAAPEGTRGGAALCLAARMRMRPDDPAPLEIIACEGAGDTDAHSARARSFAHPRLVGRVAAALARPPGGVGAAFRAAWVLAYWSDEARRLLREEGMPLVAAGARAAAGSTAALLQLIGFVGVAVSRLPAGASLTDGGSEAILAHLRWLSERPPLVAHPRTLELPAAIARAMQQRPADREFQGVCLGTLCALAVSHPAQVWQDAAPALLGALETGAGNIPRCRVCYAGLLGLARDPAARREVVALGAVDVVKRARARLAAATAPPVPEFADLQALSAACLEALESPDPGTGS